MDFNSAVALEYARQISRPRRVGTIEEKMIAQEIKTHLEKSGFRVVFQTLKFSTASELFLFLEILAGLVIILFTILTFGISPWLTALQTGLLIFLILITGPLNNKVRCSSLRIQESHPQTWWSSICWNLGKCYETKNIIATLPDPPGDRRLPQLLLVAHYDSKSQYLPLVIRIALFVLLIAGSLVFSALNLFSLLTEIYIPISISIGLLVLLAGIPLLFLDYSNDSPGAIDDGSGVGLVLHLAEVIIKDPNLSNKLGITVLITSAEELAVKGALAYVKENESSLRKQAKGGGLHVLNFDGIGVDGKIYLAGGNRRVTGSSGKNLFNLVRKSAGNLGMRVGRFGLPGALFDHIPFANEGFDALSVIGIGKSSWVVHSENDSPEQLNVAGFDQAGRLAVKVIEKLSEFQ